MQGKSTIEFGEGSSSNNSAVDHQVFFCNMLNSIESQDIGNHILSSEDTTLPFANVANHGNGSFDAWNRSNPGSRGDPTRLAILDEAKHGHNQTSALTLNSDTSLRLHDRGSETENILSLENADADSGNCQSAFGQEDDASRNLGLTMAFVGHNSQVSEAGACNLFGSCLVNSEHIRSGIGSTSSATCDGIRCLPRDGDGRLQGSLDNRLAGKRKIVEGVAEKSSINKSAHFLHQSKKNKQIISVGNGQNPSSNISSLAINPGISTLEGINPTHDTVMRASASGCNSSSSTAGSAENTPRSFRRRLNPALEHVSSPFSSWSSGNSVPHQPSFLSPSHIQLPEAETAMFFPISQAQTTVPAIPPSLQNSNSFQRSGTPNSRTGNPSTYPSRELILRRHIVARSIPMSDLRHLTQDARSGNLPTRNMGLVANVATDLQVGSSSASHPFASPTGNMGTSNSRTSNSSTHPSRDLSLRRRILRRSNALSVSDTRHLVQEPRNWNPSTGNVGAVANMSSDSQVGSSSASHPFAPPSWPSHQNLLQQCPSRLEFIGHSLPPVGSEYAVPNNNVHLLNQNPTSSQELVPNMGAGPHALHHSLRSALTDRQNESVIGIPLLLRMSAAREGRSRVISEIRSALDFIRRGENLRIEDLLMLDRSLFRGLDLHDRHRDMRLDVDNMSYEELLALEERIGDVNTGLTSETVKKHLKQQKYSPITVEGSDDVEPCCVCQEDYVEGNDLGKLDCGHEFHSECITQWLSYKNLCPVCKTTGLNT